MPPRIIQLRKVYASFHNTLAEIHANSCPQSGTRGIWTFPQWLRIFDPRPSITLREKYMQTHVPTMVQGRRGFAHKLYVYVMTLGTKMVLNHLLWDPGPMNVVIRRQKNYLAKKIQKAKQYKLC